MAKMGKSFRARRGVQGRFAWDAEQQRAHNEHRKVRKDARDVRKAKRGGLD